MPMSVEAQKVEVTSQTPSGTPEVRNGFAGRYSRTVARQDDSEPLRRFPSVRNGVGYVDLAGLG